MLIFNLLNLTSITDRVPTINTYSIIIDPSELGISLFEIAQSLFALERTFILGAMALLEVKSGAL